MCKPLLSSSIAAGLSTVLSIPTFATQKTDFKHRRREHMVQASGTDLNSYAARLATTNMFYRAKNTVAFAHGRLSDDAQNSNTLDMAFAKDMTTGDKGNLKPRFDPTYRQVAADDTL